MIIYCFLTETNIAIDYTFDPLYRLTAADYSEWGFRGSVRQLTDASGTLILSRNYDPFGNPWGVAGEEPTIFGYTGQQTDPIGMVYLRARYYIPGLGRFLTKDSYQGDYKRPPSLNEWGYVEENPINNIDPFGLWVCTPESYNINPDCDSWVQSALDRLQGSGNIGQKIIEFVHTYDKFDALAKIYKTTFCDPRWYKIAFASLPGYLMDIKIEFVQQGDWYAFTSFPNVIQINSSLVIGGESADDFGASILAHEVTHIEQGLDALSVQAELLTIIMEYQLDMQMSHKPNTWQTKVIEKLANNNLGWNPWYFSDLKIAQKELNYPNDPLWPISGSLPKNWESLWGTDIPYKFDIESIPAPTPFPLKPESTPPPPVIHR